MFCIAAINELFATARFRDARCYGISVLLLSIKNTKVDEKLGL